MKPILWIPSAIKFIAVLMIMPSALGRVLDDFSDPARPGWQDHTFMAGFGVPAVSGGGLLFAQPPAGQQIFSGTWNNAQQLELAEGRTLEIRVDIVETGAKDSFAVLAFMPNTGGNTPLTLRGYGFAKSTTDILITKGIGKYFVNEGWSAEDPNENITLALSMTVRGGNVEVTGRVLDKSDGNRVVWERTVVDTPEADVFADGTDDPAAPFITTGHFTLMLFQDFDAGAPENPYRVLYDNAEYNELESITVDDFSNAARPHWEDFTFMAGFGLPTVADSQLQFRLPPAGQQIFSGTWNTARQFELEEGERLEFEVDIAETGAKDSFAVMGFIPNTGGNNPLTLRGYGFAKSTTDVLITKGIGKYFVADAWPADGPNENITLRLLLLVRGGNVEITAQVIDKSDGNAVVWERQVIDTPEADILADGTDEPAAPFITTGYYTLLCFQDFDAGAPENPYRVFYENARARAVPLSGNTPPVLSEVQPGATANFLPATTAVSFRVTDDKAIDPSGLVVVVNGVQYTVGEGLRVSGEGNSLTGSYTGLEVDKNFLVQIIVTDSDGATATSTLHIDTFQTSNIAIEIEDYNFAFGQFIDSPVPITEGFFGFNSYNYQVGFQDVDFNETRTAPNGTNTRYRPDDAVRMRYTLDHRRSKYEIAGGANNVNNVFDYDLIDIAAGEWFNYTRTVPPGTYEVYLRQAISNIPLAESVLELVTSDPTQPGQTTQNLGSFRGMVSGFEYRNTPLTDASGQNKAVLRLSGVTTLRLRQVTANTGDGERYQNYMILVPVPEPGTQRAAVASLVPANGATVDTTRLEIVVVIENRDTDVDVSSIELEINGVAVAAGVSSTATGAEVRHSLSSLPASGVSNTAVIRYEDSEGEPITVEWSFVVRYPSLNPAHRVQGIGVDRGFTVRVVQASPDLPLLENSLQRAEDQLAPNSTIAKAYDTSVIASVINFSQEAIHGGTDGFFANDEPIPGQSDLFGTENYAMEVFTYLDLPRGEIRFGIVSDDGFKLASARSPGPTTSPLRFNNGGPANLTFDVIVPEAGVYPFRLVWYERSGGAHIEWFTVDITTNERRLVNGAGGIAAYHSVEIIEPQLRLQSVSAIGQVFGDVSGATIDTGARTATVPVDGNQRFYRFVGSDVTILSIEVSGGQVLIRYAD